MSEITAAVVRDGKVIEHVALDAAVPRHGDAEFIWIEVFDPLDGDFALLQERFGLHALAIEDSMRPTQFPKVDLYDDQIFVVLKVARLENDAIVYGDLGAFVSGRHIITVRHGGNPDRGHAHPELHGVPKLVDLRTDFLLHAVLNSVVAGYFPVVQMVEEEVLSMEQHLQDGLLERDEITRLFRLRREAIHLQHVLASMSDVCGKLTNLDVPCIGSATKPYFRDVHDQLARLDAMVRGLVDVIRTVFETSALLELQRQGIITRQLASWAAILGVPAATAAAYGMFFPDETQTPVGLAAAIGATLSICAVLYFRFRRLRWL